MQADRLTPGDDEMLFEAADCIEALERDKAELVAALGEVWGYIKSNTATGKIAERHLTLLAKHKGGA